MITAQSRGMKFQRSETAGYWWSVYSDDDGKAKVRVWEDMDETFGMSSGEADAGTAYGLALTKEGEAFRQRFVDYSPPEEARA